jgi:hypothetical protein
MPLTDAIAATANAKIAILVLEAAALTPPKDLAVRTLFASIFADELSDARPILLNDLVIFVVCRVNRSFNS